MKLKVLRVFKDKETKELYKVGAEIEVSEERGAELLKHPMKLVEEVKAKTVRKKKSGK
jgi:hypothetical protein